MRWESEVRVLVLGGDGFCGWPTSLYLSDRGHDIIILDNLSRRKIDVDLEVDSLTPIVPVGDRIKAWREVSGRDIGFVNIDLATEYDRLAAVLRELRRTRWCTSPNSGPRRTRCGRRRPSGTRSTTMCAPRTTC
jgi:nucleoside-diphosphate-sugar epimerase